ESYRAIAPKKLAAALPAAPSNPEQTSRAAHTKRPSAKPSPRRQASAADPPETASKTRPAKSAPRKKRKSTKSSS
ncbi:MAG TPA: hypothetical protein VFQ61_38885, partial [Polyangiaceae bacterium]|nr:hypothetical protein [Polyangiaceae bacterium]